MKNYNSTNHNDQGDPHRQYNNNPYRFQYITPDVSSSLGNSFGFNKVMEFTVSGYLYNLPENMRRNISKHVYVEFDIKDLNTQGAVFKSSVGIDVLVNENSKTEPFIRAHHNFLNINTNTDSTERNLFIKRTVYPTYADSDGVYPVKIEVFVSAPTYGKVSIIPKSFINQVYTSDSAVPLGAIPSTTSTTRQRFDEVVKNLTLAQPISKSNVLSVGENQKIIQVQPTVYLKSTGDTTMMSGNYGLRVLSTGIQKTSDSGTTWVNI